MTAISVSGPAIGPSARNGASSFVMVLMLATVPLAAVRADVIGSGDIRPPALLGTATGDVDVGDQQTITVGRDTAGAVTVNGGSDLRTGEGVTVGDNPGSNGVLTVTGPGSRLILNGIQDAPNTPTPGIGAFMNLGPAGAGTVSVLNGGQFLIDSPTAQSAAIQLGGSQFSGTGGSGTLNVDGAGSLVSLTGMDPIIIGGRADISTINVTNGGQISFTDSGGINGALFTMARDPGSISTLNIAGPGSALNMTSADVGTGPILQVGIRGTATAIISGGADILLDGQASAVAGIQIGGRAADAGGNGSMTVTGAGSTVTVTGGPNPLLQIGRNGTGALTIDNGANVAIGAGGFVEMARTAISSGNLLVQGTGSVLNIGGDLRLSLDSALNSTGGTSFARVINGGSITASNVYVGSGATLVGNGTINGNVTNLGGLVGGQLNSPGTLTIDGDFTFDGGTIKVEVTGLGPDEFSILNILGNFDALDGTILFSFEDGFLPDANDQFAFLNAADISGLENLDFAYEGAAAGFSFNVFESEEGVLSFVARSDALAVPEPSALALLVAGLMMVGVGARRR